MSSNASDIQWSPWTAKWCFEVVCEWKQITSSNAAENLNKPSTFNFSKEFLLFGSLSSCTYERYHLGNWYWPDITAFWSVILIPWLIIVLIEFQFVARFKGTLRCRYVRAGWTLKIGHDRWTWCRAETVQIATKYWVFTSSTQSDFTRVPQSWNWETNSNADSFRVFRSRW